MERAQLSETLPPKPAQTAIFNVLFALSFAHLLNDTIQSLIPSIYPILKESFHLDFGQIGLITLSYQVTASLLQPLVGIYTDRYPRPYSLAIGMGFTLLGLVFLSRADHFATIALSACLVGTGSAVFHPEASRVARLASGGRHGFAQSLFQVGGNFGSSLGPLLAAAIIVPRGQSSLIWFSGIALLGMAVLGRVGQWYAVRLRERPREHGRARVSTHSALSKGRISFALGILILLVFSKYFYLVSLTNYYTFYLIEHFHMSVQASQVALFVFLFAVAAGTILGGPLGDRFGRKYVIWFSILGVAPFSLLLPYVGLTGTILLSVLIGVILASAFSAILVFAQELLPGKVGLVAGLFFGLAFGIGGIASAVLGHLADRTSLDFVFHVCSFLPLIGLLTGFLPNLDIRKGTQSLAKS